MEKNEHGAKVEQMGRRAEVESRAQWLNAETGAPQKMELETGRPEVDLHHQMGQTEDELRDRQKPAGEGLGCRRAGWLWWRRWEREAGQELWKNKKYRRLEAGWDQGKQKIQWYILLKIIYIISRGQAILIHRMTHGQDVDNASLNALKLHKYSLGTGIVGDSCTRSNALLGSTPEWNLTQLGSLASYSQKAQALCLWWNLAVVPSGRLKANWLWI